MANKNSGDKENIPLTVENDIAQDASGVSSSIFLWFSVVTLLLLGAGLYWLIEQQKVAIAVMASRIEAREQQFDGELGQLNQVVVTGSVSTAQLLENLSSTDVALSKKSH